MNRLPLNKQVQIVQALVEGSSMRSASRMAGVSIVTVTKLLVDLGKVCKEYQDKIFHDLRCKRIQCDEIWSFVGMKEANVPKELKGKGLGDAWTWTAICADSKLVPAWIVGDRSAKTAKVFMDDLSKRLANRVQLTTDGNKAYLDAVEGAFGCNIDYGMLIKIYGTPQEQEKRYSPPECIGTTEQTVTGNPDPKYLSTSYVERMNLNIRMGMRRFTRLTNAFSKKVENLEHSLAIYFMYYNFCRIHQSLRSTPAMRAKITDHLWEIEDILRLLNSN